MGRLSEPGRASLGRSQNCDGPGRADTFENVIRRAGPGRARLLKIDGPGGAPAHEMWAPYGTLCPAHEAAHVV